MTSFTFGVLIEVLLRWSTERRGTLKMLPGGLLIAAACAVVSTALGLKPGYVYGLILTYVVIRDGRETDRGTPAQKGRAVLGAAVATLAVSVIAWLAWIPVEDAADRGSTYPPTLVADAVLSATYLMGVQTVLFGLIPLAFLDGYLLSRWKKSIWTICATVAGFAFVHLVYGKQSEQVMEYDGDAVVNMFTLFVLAGAASLAFWAYVRHRHRRA